MNRELTGEETIQARRLRETSLLFVNVHAAFGSDSKAACRPEQPVFVSGNWEPLASGPIALQAEWADLYFRDVKIKLLL